MLSKNIVLIHLKHLKQNTGYSVLVAHFGPIIIFFQTTRVKTCRHVKRRVCETRRVSRRISRRVKPPDIKFISKLIFFKIQKRNLNTILHEAVLLGPEAEGVIKILLE